jgi:hypothetical protein
MIPTPDNEEGFSPEWVAFVLRDYFTRNETDPDQVQILTVAAKKNEVQGILSTTYVVDVDYQHGMMIKKPKPILFQWLSRTYKIIEKVL